MAIVEFKDVTRKYIVGDSELTVLDNISVALEEDKFIVILGPSGAGKSTFLNLLGGLDSPTTGTITVDGQDIAKLSDNELAEYRAHKVGFIFQFYNLIPTLTVYENVNLIHEIVDDALSTDETLAALDLKKHRNKFPTSLSGGEQQRVSIARALVKNPQILLCDEPTGALDSETGGKVLEVLQDMTRTYGKTVVTVTHNQDIAKMADIVIHIKNGRIVSYIENKEPLRADQIEW